MVLAIFFETPAAFNSSRKKSTSSTIFNVIFVSWATNNRTKSLDWSWSNLGGLYSTSLTTTFFSCWLIEPTFHISLPILMEMGIRDHLISFGRHGEALLSLDVPQQKSARKSPM